MLDAMDAKENEFGNMNRGRKIVHWNEPLATAIAPSTAAAVSLEPNADMVI